MERIGKITLLALLLASSVYGQRGPTVPGRTGALAAVGSFSAITFIGTNGSCPTSGTTCTVTISPNISAGQAVIGCLYSNTQTSDLWLTANNNSGQSQQVLAAFSWSDPATALGTRSCLLTLNAGAQSTNITYTLSGAQDSHANTLSVWAGTYTGSPAYDGGNALMQASVSTATATTFTPSSGNDAGVMAVIAFQNINSFTGMTADQTGTHFGYGHNLSFSGAFTPTATLAASATFASNQEVYLGYSVTPPLNQTVQLFSGTNTTTPTAATLLTGTLGWTGSTWSVAGTGADLTYATAASMALQNNTGRLNDGSNTTDATTTGLAYATGHGSTFVAYGSTTGHPMTSAPAMSAFAWIQTNHSAALAENVDTLTIHGTGTDFANAMSAGSGSVRSWALECPSVTNNQVIVGITLNTQYGIDIYYSSTAPAANLALSSVANASGGHTVYTGTITGGGANALAGNYYWINSFTNAANNGGPFQATASTTTTLTLSNASGVAETNTANAAQTNSTGLAGLHHMNVYNNANPPVLQGSASCPALGQQPTVVWIGNANVASTAGFHYYFDSEKISLDGTDPLLP